MGGSILRGPCWLRLAGHGLLGLIPGFAGLLELVPPCHLGFQILQVFLAEWKDEGEGWVSEQAWALYPLTLLLALLNLNGGQDWALCFVQ